MSNASLDSNDDAIPADTDAAGVPTQRESSPRESSPIPALASPGSNAGNFRSLRTVEVTRLGIDPDSIPHRHPVTVLDFDVTENCNLGCTYCFKGEMYPRHMSLEMMKRAFEWLIEAAGNARVIGANFMGGEPTMRWKQIEAFVPWAKRRARVRGKRAHFSMTTNLTLFTDEIRRFVDEHGFGVLMSIDGCPEVQDAQRPSKNGVPVSSTVEKWARSMLETRPSAYARATAHPDYVARLYESFAYLEDIGFQSVALAAASFDEWDDRAFEFLDREYEKICDHIVRQIQSGTTNVAVIVSWQYCIGKLIRRRRSGVPEDEFEIKRQPCGAGKGYMMVDYQGDVWPCHRFDGADADQRLDGQLRLGNILKPGFNNELQDAFLGFDHSRDHKAGCRTCPVNPVCGGFCPAANISDTGTLHSPHDAFCRWSQTNYKFADKLYAEVEGLNSAAGNELLRSCDSVAETGEK